jgi:hypothetical protein
MISSPRSSATSSGSWHRGQIAVKSKDELRKRGLPSPDRADALVYTFAQVDLPLSTLRIMLGEHHRGSDDESGLDMQSQSDTRSGKRPHPLLPDTIARGAELIGHRVSRMEAIGVELMPIAQQLSPEGAIVTAIFVSVVLVWALRF